MAKPEISYIVSAYDRPTYLQACLASLMVQTEIFEVFVCLNHTAKHMIRAHKKVCRKFRTKTFKVHLILTGKQGARCCYSSAEMVARKVRGKWLCFPSDDSLYVPDFSYLMLHAAREHNLDLVYCDMVFDPMSLVAQKGRYGHLVTEPKVRGIDKTAFMVKRKWFLGFPGKQLEGSAAADGLVAEDLVRRGANHGKAEGILVVHS